MKVAIGADHRGYRLKSAIIEYLRGKSVEVIDFGTDTDEVSVDYPDYAIPVAEAVAKGDADRGILICMTGVGMSITANKVKGVRAGLIYIPNLTELARKHNNINVLCLPGGYMEPEKAYKAVDLFLNTEFEGGRHERRISKIAAYEEEKCKNSG